MAAAMELPALVPTLSSLAHDANVELAAIEANDADSLQRAIRAGEYLIHAKELCPKGQWQTWVAENVAVTASTVRNYIRVATYSDDIAHCASILQAIACLAERDLTCYSPGDTHHASTAVAAERAARAVSLRSAGHTYQEIAQELGISRTGAVTAANRDANRARVREAAVRRTAKQREAAKALAEKEQRAAVKRHGGQPEAIYTSIIKACESAGRMAEEKPEHKAEADAILADLYRAKDKILALIGAS